MLALLLVVACSMPPHAQETSEYAHEPEYIEPEPVQTPKPKRHKPKPVAVKPMPKADELCPPPVGTETDQQKMLRKIDCLLERD